MAPARLRSAVTGGASLALGALILTAAAATDAAADGERSPVLGGFLVGGQGPDPDTELAGLQLDVAWWYGRLGLALEGAAHWTLGGDEVPAKTLGASARIRLFEQLLPALLEPRDVELGVELHGIVQRTWSGDADPSAGPRRLRPRPRRPAPRRLRRLPEASSPSPASSSVSSPRTARSRRSPRSRPPTGPIFLTMSPSDSTTTRELDGSSSASAPRSASASPATSTASAPTPSRSRSPTRPSAAPTPGSGRRGRRGSRTARRRAPGTLARSPFAPSRPTRARPAHRA